MRFAVTRLDLGKTRTGVGYVIYNDVSKAFEELTPSEVKELIKKDEISGLMLVENEIKIDNSYCKNMMRKSGVGNFSPILDHRATNLTSVLSVVSKNETEYGFMYEVISNFCQRLIMSEDTLLSYNKTGVVNGITVDENNRIFLHPKVGTYFITKPDTFNKNDLISAKIDLNTEEGIERAEQKKKENTTEAPVNIEEIIDSCELDTDKNEEIDSTIFDNTDFSNNSTSHDAVAVENKSKSMSNTGDTAKSKPKRNSKNA